MKGLALCRAYFEAFGKPLLMGEFAPYAGRIAAGLCGPGSECFGYDDAHSRDHDFAPGFCLWLTDEDEAAFGFRLARAYDKLPKEFMGVQNKASSRFGNGRRGVQRISDFYCFYLPSGKPPQCAEEWLAIPDPYLAEATNGTVFCDPLGHFSLIRQSLMQDCPDDVWLCKLASSLFYMAQSGQYNYKRCLVHGERAAAALALAQFAEHTVHAIYLLNRRYMPYYKWAVRGMTGLLLLGHLQETVEELLARPYEPGYTEERIEALSACVAGELHRQGLCDTAGDYLEPYAYAVKDRIQHVGLRNGPVML